MKLTDDERWVFGAWVRTVHGFRPDFASGAAIGTREMQQASLTAIGGTVTKRNRVQSLDELVDTWRSLGCPTPKTRQYAARARYYRLTPRTDREVRTS